MRAAAAWDALYDPLAQKVLVDQGLGLIGAQIADGRNKGLKVERNIPVYVAYFTAWPKADGTVEYFDDIYERDMYLRRAMDATDGERHAQS